MKRYKIFLASSGELSLERKEIALMISPINNKWTDEKYVYLELENIYVKLRAVESRPDKSGKKFLPLLNFFFLLYQIKSFPGAQAGPGGIITYAAFLICDSISNRIAR
ncbi:MAG: hypothetical protein QG657_1601 [Acidobacteriota bacterium]|nr:hypothetical protein [Acidobacteriota bacterium]